MTGSLVYIIIDRPLAFNDEKGEEGKKKTKVLSHDTEGRIMLICDIDFHVFALLSTVLKVFRPSPRLRSITSV